MNTKKDRFLKNIYYNPQSPSSFSSLHKIWTYIKSVPNKPKGLTKSFVKQWLQYQNTASVHKPFKINFPREKIIVSAIDQTWDIDLADLSQLKKENKGVTFILVAIDLLSRYCWLRPLKSKKGEEVKNAMADIFNTDNRKPLRIRSDFGKEFYNKHVREYLTQNNIHHYSTFSEKKANYVERLIRTIKNKLFKYMYDNQTTHYIDVLQDIAKSYNNTIHSSIQIAPADVTTENDLDIYMKFYMPFVNKTANIEQQFSFNIGDSFRIAYNKGKFSRGYNEQFSEEIFTIADIIASVPPRYQLIDALNEKN